MIAKTYLRLALRNYECPKIDQTKLMSGTIPTATIQISAALGHLTKTVGVGKNRPPNASSPAHQDIQAMLAADDQFTARDPQPSSPLIQGALKLYISLELSRACNDKQPSHYFNIALCNH